MHSSKHSSIETPDFPHHYYPFLISSCFLVFSQSASAADPFNLLELNNTTINQSQVSQALSTGCQAGLGGDFQTRCNSLAGARGNGFSNDDFRNVLSQVTSQQTATQNTQALEMNNPQLSNLSNRISLIRSGKQKGGLRVSGLMYDANGNPISKTQLAKLNDTINKAAAGDDGFSRLGAFINGNIGFGDRRTTANEAGYNLDSHGTTAGLDYRIGRNALIGVAFSYDNSRSGFLSNLGDTKSDTYSGAIYGSFFTDNGFFVDGIFSGGHTDYSSRRNIQYNATSQGGESFNAVATGKTQGSEFNVAMTTGYNLSLGALTVTPQVRIDYTTNHVDALDEQGGRGWGLHIADQSFESLQTVPGLQLAYAISTPWAVISPMVRAEYIHEFENNARNISAYFRDVQTNDPSKTSFAILTDTPDRDYIVASAGLSAQFIHGVSAFVNYDTVQAHSYVNNHNFSGGVRLEVPF